MDNTLVQLLQELVNVTRENEQLKIENEILRKKIETQVKEEK